jgi:hypothetical protein
VLEEKIGKVVGVPLVCDFAIVEVIFYAVGRIATGIGKQEGDGQRDALDGKNIGMKQEIP